MKIHQMMQKGEKIIASKASNGLVELRLVANKIALSTLEGVVDGMGNDFLTTTHEMYVTVNGTDYPVQFR